MDRLTTDRIEYQPGIAEPLDTLTIEVGEGFARLHTLSDQIEVDLDQLRWLVEVGGPAALRPMGTDG